jgi:spore maturation protein CgeB
VKIVVAGDGHSELHEVPVCAAFEALGHEVHRYYWCSYFEQSDTNGGVFAQLHDLAGRFQNKYLIGPLIDRINNHLVALVEHVCPDILFIYRGTHITRRTLQRIKSHAPRTRLIGYNNDDPFSPGHPRWLWRHFVNALPAYDLVLAYRHHNVEEYLRGGAKRSALLRSWFVPERNHPLRLDPKEVAEFGCDVAFVGHYEADQRVEFLEEVVRQGVSLKLYGPGYDWDPVLAKSRWLRDLRPVKLVWGENYNKALCGAKVALCFLSKLNRDSYTRRCFEIPATKTMMLAEYSKDLASLYEEGREAEYFRSKSELIEKVRLYTADDERRQAVAGNGYRRVYADRHDVVSRMADVLKLSQEIAVDGFSPSI